MSKNKLYTIETPLDQFRSNVSAGELYKAFNNLRPGVPFSTNPAYAEAITKSCEQYNVDQIYLAAHAILESDWGRSRFAKDRNNLFGFGAYDSNPDNAWSWPTIDAGVEFVCKYIKQQYLDPSGKWFGGSPTLKGMHVHYATAGHWATAIANLANQLDDQLVLQPQENTSPPVLSDPTPGFYPHEMNVVITPVAGVNVRTAPVLNERNVTTALAVNTKVKVIGFVQGDKVNGNGLWWKTQDDNYIWSGATNITPSIPAVSTEPVLTPESMTLDEIHQKLVELNDGLAKALETNKALRTEVDSCKKEATEANELAAKWKKQAESSSDLKTANEELSATVLKLNREVNKNRIDWLADEFKQWKLMQIEGNGNRLSQILGLLTTLSTELLSNKGTDIVLGLKLNARIKKVES